MVGTGASTGYRDEFLGPDTGTEVAAVIEEIANRAWTTGRVGMIGKSFPGALCLATGVRNPDPLEAIVPILTTHRRERVAYERGGLPSLWLTISMVALYTATGVQPPSRRDSGWEDIWRTRLDHYREEGPPFAQAFDPDPTDSYWDLTVPTEEIQVPTFAVGGYRDHFPTDTLEYFAAIDAPKRLLMGPWRHIAPFKGRETAIGFRSQVVDWFDRFLKDEEAEPFRPTIAYWTERNGGRLTIENTEEGAA
ncbi:MAG: CocE/NonD family hydrolase, partial [Halobacteria archaeon]|nr:CocE/NonD family hydrolase [Halobacteria archaeon]